MTPSYYRRADAVVLVYDITDLKSFEDLPSWYADVRKYAKENVKMIVVGHKLDLVCVLGIHVLRGRPSKDVWLMRSHHRSLVATYPIKKAIDMPRRTTALSSKLLRLLAKE